MNSSRFPWLLTNLIAIMIFIQGCNLTSGGKDQNNKEVSSLISMTSNHGVSVKGPILIEFTEVITDVSIDIDDILDFSPSFEYTSKWIGNQQLIITPTEKLKSGTKYEVEVDLPELYPTKEGIDDYSFNFKTIVPNFTVVIGSLESNFDDPTKMSCKGSIKFNDVVDADKAKAALSVESDKKYKIEWTSVGSTFFYKVDNITRKDKPFNVTFKWNGKELDIDRTGKKTLTVPAMGDFKYQAIRVTSSTSPVITVSFSEPLNTKQNLKGLFRISGCKLGATISGNKVILYPDSPLSGEQVLNISSSLKSSKGKKLGTSFTKSIYFTSVEPELTFEGEGNIVPNASGFIIPFSAVNLDAVDIRIVRIFQNNIPFFLQQHNITSSSSSPRRYGRIVYSEKMKLEGNVVNEKSAYAINIPEIIDVKPNEIYQVTVGMRPTYSTYPCKTLAELRSMKLKEPKDNGFWDNDDVWGEEDYYQANNLYDWRKRDDASNAAYYSSSRSISRYVISSNIGLIAKKEEGNVYHIAASDLISSAPMDGVKISLLNFQNQVVAEQTTDKDGFAKLKTLTPAILVLAQKGDDWGFLKLGSNEQMISDFDVSGTVNKNQITAYTYGERDVWRPGDSIFVSTIIKDPKKHLGDSYPVVYELYDTKGVLKDKKVMMKKESMVAYRTATKQVDPTGNWTLKVKFGGLTFNKVLRIETFRPNRMKIKWVDEPESLEVGKISKEIFNTKWLHGLPAKSKRMTVDARVRRKKIKIKGYAGYSFQNEVSTLRSSYRNIWDGKTDDKGNANVALTLSKENIKEPLVALDLETRVYEDGGTFSTSEFSKDYYPFKNFVGMRISGTKSYGSYYDTEKNINCDLVVLKPNLAKGFSLIKYQVYKVDYSWWWDASSVSSLARYVDGRRYSAYKSGNLNSKDGKASFAFQVRDRDWGRYLIVVKLPDGNTVTKVIFCDWPGNSKKDGGAENLLNLNLKKERVVKGENIELLFPSEKGGHALISIEKGAEVVKQIWVKTEDNQTTVSIPTEGVMAPNVYLYVTYIQPYQVTQNDHPIRLYGIQRVKVEDPETHLKPVIQCKDEVRAKRKIKVEVSEGSGQPMDYTLAIVDEGLLGITNFKTPAPWTYFYREEALRVSTWDIYNDILGMYSGRLGKLVPVGGDGMLDDPSHKKAKRFKPVVMYAGPFHLNAGDKETHEFPLPSYSGEVRVMVVASNERSYGSTEKPVKVVDPLMILADAPRTLDLEETFKLPVSIFANKEMDDDVEVSVNVSGTVALVGEAKQSVSMGDEQEKDAYFNLKTSKVTGPATIVVSAKSGSYSASYKIDIHVDNSNPIQYKVVSKKLEPGESYTYDAVIKANEIGKSLSINASTMIACNMDQRMEQLIVYPHGCLEQTTSSVFPQLLMLKDKNIDSNKRQTMEDNVQRGLRRLLLFQKSDGSFSYWPGGHYSSEWASCYAGHFMVMAKKAGYFIPGDMLTNWISYQMSLANRWSLDDNDVVQSYRLFVLVMAGEAPLGAMNRMREGDELITNSATPWLLSAAYAQLGRKETAESLIDLRDLSYPSYEKGWSSSSFGSKDRDKAIRLMTLDILGKRDIAFTLAKDLAKKLSSDVWMSTQTTCFALIAMHGFMSEQNDDANITTLTSSIDGDKTSSQVTPVVSSVYDNEFKKTTSIEIENKGNKAAYITINQSYQRSDAFVKPSSNILTINPILFDEKKHIVKDSVLVQGKDYKLTVSVRNQSNWDLEEIALTIPLPSGVEILNRKSALPEYINYQEVRDSEVYSYFDLDDKESVEVEITFNASYTGVYKWPAISVEAMYNHQIHANSAAKVIEIK
ncbi:Ig-like domain-containing protein [Halosquirtibacter xylanolyticus]|uniref:Ig-like domain-containing alpha-2-macroglobulin family protein n=1 Tax=Halosquirtibacter xylanolyticus TaxID=3374599 RepID=UPI003748D3EC|nr:Ig-like domain-containing protein [Prolixibacteraceae bacterium]